MAQQSPTRIFVVGCPRSGTTLLQSLLAAHPDLTSFPETHFFNHYADATFDNGLAGLLRRELRDATSEFFRGLDRDDLARRFETWHINRRPYAEDFVDALDALARDRGADGWVEKTPSHLERIDTIETLVPGAKFIHIVRRGTDVVASLHQVTHEHPEEWGGERSVERCIERWNRSMRLTNRYLSSSTHEMVGYRQLTDRPKTHLRRLCTFLGLDYDPKMLEDYGDEADRVSEAFETWKEGTDEPIEARGGSKFEQRFDEETRERIREDLDPGRGGWPAEISD